MAVATYSFRATDADFHEAWVEINRAFGVSDNPERRVSVQPPPRKNDDRPRRLVPTVNPRRLEMGR